MTETNNEVICESWEELIKDSPTEETKSIDKSINESTTCTDNSSNKLNLDKDLNKIKIKKKDISYSNALNKNLSNTKILNRDKNPTINQPTSASIILAANSSKNIQITFEDNLRAQFIPNQQTTKVKILQRPKESIKNDNSNNFKNGFFNAKTIKEREAEYAKARLRILGKDYSNEDDSDQSSNPISSNQFNDQSINREMIRNSESNLIRKPQAPNHSLNFSQRTER